MYGHISVEKEVPHNGKYGHRSIEKEVDTDL